MAKDEQRIIDLRELAGKIDDKLTELKNCLDDLTEDMPSSKLHMLKKVVGQNTDLGQSISATGTAIMHLKIDAIDAFTSLRDLINATADEAAKAAVDAAGDFDEITNTANDITFKH